MCYLTNRGHLTPFDALVNEKAFNLQHEFPCVEHKINFLNNLINSNLK